MEISKNASTFRGSPKRATRKQASRKTKTHACMLSKKPHLRAHFLSRQANLPGVNNHDDCRSKTARRCSLSMTAAGCKASTGTLPPISTPWWPASRTPVARDHHPSWCLTPPIPKQAHPTAKRLHSKGSSRLQGTAMQPCRDAASRTSVRNRRSYMRRN